jgi:hypothetical protein
VRVFLYEYVSGGGTWGAARGTAGASSSGPPNGSLLVEGAAMIRSLAADFARVEGFEVVALRDVRLSDFSFPDCRVHDVANADRERRLIIEQARSADWTVLIAPECDGALLEKCRWAEQAGARLLSPSSAFIEIAGDKHRTAERLASAGVRVPAGIAIRAGEPLPDEFDYPAVLKPRLGAGSEEVRLVRGPYEHVARERREREKRESHEAQHVEFRLERFCSGTPASVAILCGPREYVALPACRQLLSDDGLFRYLGGGLPLHEAWNKRASDLAVSAVRALPPAIGYVGVDLVLGARDDGRDDVVIEVNPRLTTSYVGLRASCRGNLAQAMLNVAQGKPADLSFAAESVEFTADGATRISATTP